HSWEKCTQTWTPRPWPPPSPKSAKPRNDSASAPSETGPTASSYRPKGSPRTAPPHPPSTNSNNNYKPWQAPTSGCPPPAGCPASATPPAWPSTTEPAECSWPVTPHTSTHPPEDKASTSAFRTHSTSAGNWPPPATAGHPRTPGQLPHRTTPRGRRRARQHPRTDATAVHRPRK